MTLGLGQWSSLTRRWVLGVVPLLLALTAWWCYAGGTVTRTDRVTVTRAKRTARAVAAPWTLRIVRQSDGRRNAS